ncbi:flagellar basal-body rod protein FlgG [Falsigemmobacter intermedius]|uniref:Flagellar basal-body rod protein FlgG n=1 Tax=Falsigemmobacter intermedius TaxID=1553448 RepID=A0A3S3YGF2_9RHOB|nr:flagellar basal-body rod protein FlgG [Falsigemmobacter intermedius]RWY43064.1 flagellar basal-body rod protein FlgG [Falsigemmobacter intermedius]
MKALGIAASGMLAQQTNVDVIANNIANANTTGFKAGRAAFQDLLYQSDNRAGALVADDGAIRPVGVDIGLGVATAGIMRLNTQGGMTETGNQLDLAIQGRGYFQITLPDGTTAYTRAGNFTLSPEGEIVTNDGYPLDPGFAVPEEATSVQISADGVVSVLVPGEMLPQELGEITLAGFINEAGLRPMGNNLLAETAASGAPVLAQAGDEGFGTLRQFYVEASNVDVIRQITDLISAQRAYEMNSKAITTADQMMQTAVQVR